jgi:hypothetical protein
MYMGDMTMVRKNEATDGSDLKLEGSRRAAAARGSAMSYVHPKSEGSMGRDRAGDFRNREAGLTMIEILVIMILVVILSIIAIGMFQNQREKVKLVKCMAEIRGIQAAVYSMGDGRYIPNPTLFWESAFPDGRKHGPYYYIVDGDPNAGHGNDLDGVDEENPGASDPDKKDIKFVIFCEHDHGDLGKYVYLTDEEPPTIATEDNDPNYQRFIKWEFGGPGAKKHK